MNGDKDKKKKKKKKNSKLTTLLTQPNIQQLQQHKTHNVMSQLISILIQQQQVQLCVCLQPFIQTNCHCQLKVSLRIYSLAPCSVTVSFSLLSFLRHPHP